MRQRDVVYQFKRECISASCYGGADGCRLEEIADEEEAAELEAHEACGRWDNGRLTRTCRLAGTEHCDWECPHNLPVERTPKPMPLFEDTNQ